MTYDFATMPLSIYADLLEEQGLDVTELRAWVPLGDGSESYFYGHAEGVTRSEMSRGAPMHWDHGEETSTLYRHYLIGLATCQEEGIFESIY